MSRMVNVHSLKPSLVGMDWDESPETHENYRQSERLDLYQKYIDQLLAEGKPTNLMLQKKSWQQNVNVKKAAGETPRYINEYLGMSEEEKAAISQNVKQQV